jgi:hypothetical protein
MVIDHHSVVGAAISVPPTAEFILAVPPIGGGGVGLGGPPTYQPPVKQASSSPATITLQASSRVIDVPPV